ncbi:MAG: ABC transporter ATP-binding protein [Lewinellaceae bacterium]|nr:ABC transporter ATP-binding protein [Lewinellaceae bacterium]
MSKILEINDLTVDFLSTRGSVRAVDQLSLFLNRGETLGIVGESGSGKSVTALSIMQLLPRPAAKIVSGTVHYGLTTPETRPVDLLQLPEDQLRRYRGAEIAMIFQEPMTSLNPVFRCGHQVTEAIQLHRKMPFDAAKKQTLELFERVKLPDPQRIFNAFPHQISGGQKQRVMIAMAMSCSPSILIADEPTTALDVTVQKAILDLMNELKGESGLSMLFISHDLGVVSEICDRVIVMLQGRIVEEGPVDDILNHPRHPYTRGLVACRPSINHRLHRLPTVSDFTENRGFEPQVINPVETAVQREKLYRQPPLLQVKDLAVRYPSKKNWLGQVTQWHHAVDAVSFDVFPGETFGLAGESGCGKTTLGRTIAKLTEAYSGEVVYKGENTQKLKEEDFRPYRREIQVVFQDPYSSLNPRMTVGNAIVEPMQVHKLYKTEQNCRDKAVSLLETVGLSAEHFQRYPHEFSGGQRQRICIARALAMEPSFLICDEIVSALDVSVQATVLNLLKELQEKYGLTYLFISHDLSVIRQMCDRLMIMNRGQSVTIGFPDEIFDNPQQEYVQQLIDALPGKQ